MPQRPPWTAYIVPAGVNIKQLDRQISRYETDFYHNDAQLRRRISWGGLIRPITPSPTSFPRPIPRSAP